MEPNQHFDRSEVLAVQGSFYVEGKYSDVKLEIGDEVFECHRLILASISEYFDKMFSGSFKEKIISDEPIVLSEIDPTAFKEILNLVFTGSVCVSASNVYALLRASDFLQLRTLYVEDQCYEYLRSNISEPVPNAFEILSFSHATGRKRFVDILKVHILEHVRYFSEDSTSVEIPFEVLIMLLECTANNENNSCKFYARGNILLKLIIRWINYSRKERNKYRSQLLKTINSSTVSTDYALFLLMECENLIDGMMNSDENIELLSNFELYPKDDFGTGTTFTFKKENFSKMELGHKMNSPLCQIQSLQWVMTILNCPNPTDNTFTFLAVALNFNGEYENCDVFASVTVVSQKEGVKDLTQNRRNTFSKTGKRKTSNNTVFVTKWEFILEAENGYIKDDTVIFKARISF